MLEALLGKEITFYVKQHIGKVILSMILAAVASLFVVLPAALLQPFVDEGMQVGNDPVCWKIPWIALEPGSWLSWRGTDLVLIDNITPNRLLIILSILIFLSVVCKSVLNYFSEFLAVIFSSRAVLALRVELFEKYISLPLEFHDKKKSGELISRATADLGAVQEKVVEILIGLIQYPVTAIVFLVYLFVCNYRLTLLVFIVGPIIVGLTRLFGRKLKKHAVVVQDATADITSIYQESLMCLKITLGFCKEDYETKKFTGVANRQYKQVMKMSRWALGTSPALDTAVFFMLPSVLVIGKIYFDLTLGELVSMGYAISRLYNPVKKLSKLYNSVKILKGSTKRVFAIMNTTASIQDGPEGKKLPQHNKLIEFRQVDFSFSPGAPILKDISFKAKAGEMVAFVGKTGAGKSTIMDLIPRFYDVTDGSILIDGTDIRDVTLDSLRRQIGIVSQETLLFNLSIAHNIGYGQINYNLANIESAAKVANAHEFILAQPDSYQTIIGDQGSLLSGGQRQRLSIARAILIDPTILILDEAAAALDAESEKLVQAAIENLHGTRTILVVAHRLSTILKADQIHVLENGRIIESGTLKDLLDLNGRFRQLYDIQFDNNSHS